MWICKICNLEWETIPDGAVLVSKRGVNSTYRFLDRTIHVLYQARTMSAKTKHNRWHTVWKEKDCEFCNPPPPKEPQPVPPVEQIESVQEVEVLAESSEPVEEVTTTDDPETIEEVKPTTAMAAASRNLKR